MHHDDRTMVSRQSCPRNLSPVSPYLLHNPEQTLIWMKGAAYRSAHHRNTDSYTQFLNRGTAGRFSSPLIAFLIRILRRWENVCRLLHVVIFCYTLAPLAVRILGGLISADRISMLRERGLGWGPFDIHPNLTVFRFICGRRRGADLLHPRPTPSDHRMLTCI